MTPILIPPGVCGRNRGSISISIDEVFWSGTSLGEIYVKFSWWGSDEVYEFFPKDLTKVTSSNSKKPPNGKTTSYTFPVGTSVRLLENYFRKWKSMNFNVFRINDKRYLGCVQVENWECILAESKYGSYFAILDRKGTRLGDLHIVFSLEMKKKKYKLKSDFPMVNDPPAENVWGSGDNDVLADLVNRGQELRKDMVKSVLSSCDTKDIDEVVEETQPAVRQSTEDMSRKAKLVDFLMGKELTEPEKEIALQTLRCTSPTDSILEVAATIGRSENQEDTAPPNEDAYLKKFCSVGDKKVPVPSEGKRNTYGQGDQLHVESNNFSKDLHHQVTAAGDFQLEKFPRQSLDGTKKTFDPSVNSFKITFGVMTLTALGLKKVSTSPTIKPLSNKIRTAKSPGIVFSLETFMPYASKCKAAYLKPVTMSSKAFGGNDVVFNDSIIQKLCRSGESAWSKVAERVSGLPIKVYWRCLNQRIPSLLGQCLLPDELGSEDFESCFHLTLQMANKQAAALLGCKIELGAANVFGNELLGNKKIRKTRLESMLPQLSEAPSVVSDKTVSQDNSKESFSFPPPPVPPPSSRCRTASSTTTTNFREPLESDHHLMNAISNLNDKLTKKSSQVRLVEGANEDGKNKESEDNEPAPAKIEEPKLPKSSEIAGGGDEKGGTCQDKSPRRGCCCCCRGCLGDCKRRKPLRKHLRDRRPLHRGPAGKHDDQTSTAISNSDGGMSPGDQEILDQVNAYLRGSRFHSPPTKLTRKHRNPTNQGNRVGESPNQPERLDTLFKDDRRARKDYVKSKTHSSDLPYGDPYKKTRHFNVEDKFLPRTPEEPSSVHRFSVNVYSSDAQIFYREGELELYMAYRFPQTDPVSGKLFCPAEVSSIELSGDAAPVTHYLPLRTSLSEALLSYPKQNITFHVWARAYMYEKRDFLIGQAKLPLEKLVEWEAAHIYSQKRRIDHPLLPPDKHFINLRIHPSKSQLPQHLEPGRIAQLGLEIDYEKFRDVGHNSFDRWPSNLAPSTDSPPERPFLGTSRTREEISDVGDPYLNARREPGNKSTSWGDPRVDHQDFRSSEPLGKWGLRVRDSFSNPEDSRMPASSNLESGRQARLGVLDNEPNYRSTLNKASDLREDDDELMLILDGRSNEPSPSTHNSIGKTKPYGGLPPERHDLEADHHNGTWADEQLQFQSISRLDPAKASDFVPNADCHQQFLSPRVDRDFPVGVKTADFSSDNNSGQRNPFEVSVTVHPQPKPNSANTRIRTENQPSPLPALARVIDPNYQTKEPSPIPRLDSSLDLGSESKATQTTVNGQIGIDLFSVRIEVEAAINLLPTIQDGVHSQPSSRVEFDAWSKGREIIVQSSVVNNDTNPKYDSAWNVELPAHLLYKGESEFELRVVNVDDGTISSAFIDLTTLSAGLPSIDGWYFLSSHGHKSAGQVKVSITPMESIRKYRDEWIEEFRKRKHESKRCIDDRISCESAQKIMLNDSSSMKFKEKMKELEQLTERMRQKLMNADRWDDSPPCTLMTEVNDFAQKLVQETTKSADNRTTSRITSSTPCEGLPELDLRTVQEFCPIDSEGEQDFRLRTSTVTAHNPPPTFLDYAPVSRIRKPLSKTLSASREKFDDSDDSAGILGGKLSLEKCHKELEQLPKDSLDAASIAIEQMIADLRNQKIDDSKS